MHHCVPGIGSIFFNTRTTKPIKHRRFHTGEQSRHEVFEYIEVLQNLHRKFWRLGYRIFLERSSIFALSFVGSARCHK